MRRSLLGGALLGMAAVIAGAVGCSASDTDLQGSTGGSTGNSGSANGSSAANGASGANGSGSFGSNGNLSGGNSGGMTFASNLGNGNSGDLGSPDSGCAGVEQRAEKREGGRADVIFAIDNSFSMIDEIAAVQANLNTFSQFITSQGIDVHVVLVAAPAELLGPCIDAPLGAQGACQNLMNDTNLPAYKHVGSVVDSHNALVQLQGSYAQYSDMLRPDAVKTFVVVSDDEAQPPDAAGFQNWVNSEPLFQQAIWRFSGIFCATGALNCFGVGTTYNTLAQSTGGVVGDLAQIGAGNINMEFQKVFNQLADVLVKDAVPVDCEWSIPDPPNGEELDPDLVLVRFTNSAQVTNELYAVGDSSQCRPETGGWYYDNPANPTRVVACPSSCEVMQADENAVVEVVFGCAPEPVPPPE